MLNKYLEKYKVFRSTSGEYVKGTWQPGAVNEIEIDALVRPKSTYELKREFEGRSIRAAIKIFSKVPFEFGKKSAGPDFIEYNGDKFEIVSSWNESKIIPHVVSVGVLFVE